MLKDTRIASISSSQHLNVKSSAALAQVSRPYILRMSQASSHGMHRADPEIVTLANISSRPDRTSRPLTVIRGGGCIIKT